MVPCDSVPASDVHLEVWSDLMGPLTVDDFVLFSDDDVFLSSNLLVPLLLLDSGLVGFECSFDCELFGFSFAVLLLPVTLASSPTNIFSLLCSCFVWLTDEVDGFTSMPLPTLSCTA